jgi:hypothetical protein
LTGEAESGETKKPEYETAKQSANDSDDQVTQ